MCENCDHQNQNDSGFIFGMVIGAVIGAVVAIYVYKHNQDQVFTDLKSKLENYFRQFVPSPPKKTSPPKSTPRKKATRSKPVPLAISVPEKLPVVLPAKIVAAVKSTKTKAARPGKMFKR